MSALHTPLPLPTNARDSLLEYACVQLMLWLNDDVIDDPTNSWNWYFLLEITSRGRIERKEEEGGHKKKNDLVIAQSVKVSKYASPTDAVIL